MDIGLNIGEGTCSLTAKGGRTVEYARKGVASNPPHVHIMWDQKGGFALSPLLDAEDFPEELIIYHESPGGTSQGPVGMVGVWFDHFRYVRKN